MRRRCFPFSLCPPSEDKRHHESQSVDVQNRFQEVKQAFILMQPFLAVALSGGIDSLVSAALLKEQGHRLIGLHFLTGYEAGFPVPESASVPGGSDAIAAFARKSMDLLAAQIDIPIYVIDLRSHFQRQVVRYFVDTYAGGRTPNPCLVCNPTIKYGLLLSEATRLGASGIATGHYARIERSTDGRIHLLRGRDAKKEQSYFLSRLTQHQLAAATLPLGHLTKAQTRHIAQQMGLVPVSRQESQDICFIRSKGYADFLMQQPGFAFSPGPIENSEGETIGRHNGLHRFTIGQRRGINCPAARPYYVIRIDMARNCLIVGDKEQLLSRQCHVRDINWIGPPPTGSMAVETKVRYRHEAVKAIVTPIGESDARVVFETPEPAVTPGQGAVFYQGDEVLGGGWIE